MKLVTLSYPGFEGFVCYTGFAKERATDTIDTVDHIVDWLTETENFRFYQIVERLQQRATDHIAGVQKLIGVQARLTMIAAAFVDGKARAAIISNFQNDLGYTTTTANDAFDVSWAALNPGEPPVILVTGKKSSVTPAMVDSLQAEIVDAGEDSGRVRNAIKSMNRFASATREANSAISRECTVVSLDSGGNGVQDFDPVAGIDSRHIYNGFANPFADTVASLGLVNATVVGASFATSKPSIRKPSVCGREALDISESGYKLVEIIHVTDMDCLALGISDAGTVLGYHSDPNDRTVHRYWTWSFAVDELAYLDLECRFSSGGRIGADGQLVVLTGSPDIPRILAFDEHRVMRELEIPDGMGEPEVTAINTSGECCGTIAVSQDRSDGDRNRPAYWDARGAIHIMHIMESGTSGRSVDITASGLVLVVLHHGMFGRTAATWRPEDGLITQVPGEIIPMSISESGAILGFDGNEGRDVAVVSYDQNTWQRQPLNNGFAPTGWNQERSIIGHVMLDGYNHGWIAEEKGTPHLLPSFRYHNTHPRYINRIGVVVGQLSADYEQHVVAWTPSKKSAKSAR